MQTRGGGPSLVRTRLRINVPKSREEYRQFRILGRRQKGNETQNARRWTLISGRIVTATTLNRQITGNSVIARSIHLSDTAPVATAILLPEEERHFGVVGNALLMMDEGGFRHGPVIEHGKPLGMISARDALGSELQEFEGELMQREHIGEVLH